MNAMQCIAGNRHFSKRIGTSDLNYAMIEKFVMCCSMAFSFLTVATLLIKISGIGLEAEK